MPPNGIRCAASRLSPAAIHHPMSKLVANLGLLILLVALGALAARHSLFSPSPYVIAAQVAGVGLAIWARQSFVRGSFRVTAGPAAETVLRRGPYRFVRHPMYAGAALVVWSSILGHWSPVNATIGVVVVGMLGLRIVVEERLLRARYSDYTHYARSTRCLIPFLL
jgi:protein-S-isoprenylcysteine O-methyltransferase Ste14